ncbi:MAG: cysteine desulfurase family protein [bacterium]|nr:cysteine desulfurase family protein [bacterium]
MFNKQCYFDIGATPLATEVAAAMAPFWQEQFGNPESIHTAGQEARVVVEQARSQVASLIKAKPTEIIFTSGATESDNLALKGVAWQQLSLIKQCLAVRDGKNELLISPIEHPAVREAAESLRNFGFQVIYLQVDNQGHLDLQDLQNKISPRTLLVSVIAASNQFGVIQDLEAIGRICTQAQVLFHTDASVYFGLEKLDVQKMHLDLATLSSPKIYGPKGIAALYKRENLKLMPLFHGGGQENGCRSGTHNVPAIVGFAAAATRAYKLAAANAQHYRKLSRHFINLIKDIPAVQINGDQADRLPNNLHLSVLGVEGESLVLALNEFGICASSGSACSSRKLQADPALKALHLVPEAVHGSLRFFWHEWTTLADVEYLADKLHLIIERLRAVSACKIS